MTTETEKQLLTPAQFIVARALASAYNHLWASVPDGTYDIADIEAYSKPMLDSRLPGGITAPTLVQQEGSEFFWSVVHTTGSGRLTWEVLESGTVILEIRRPSDLSRWRAQTARTFGYAAISSVQPPDDPGILVARIKVINDDDTKFASSISTEKYEFYYETSKCDQSRDADSERFESAEYNPEICDDLLFERHVHALIRPLVALLTINTDYEPGDVVDDAAYAAMSHDEQWQVANKQHNEYRERVINPAIERAKMLLAPLFAKALPDPFFNGDVYDEEVELPQTFWSQPRDEYSPDTALYVHHRSESFPVESEKTAVHAVLLLQRNPEMSLVDAVKAAIRSKSYRPK